MFLATLTKRETARARHHTYTLLSRLYLEGLNDDLLPYVRALPVLAAQLEPEPDLAEAAATHYRLFGLNLFPYESVFLDPEGLLGGAVSAQVADRYEANGYRSGTDVAADHLGHQLGLLAHLCAAEADAWEDGRERIARQMYQRQQSFLAQHLTRWLSPFLVALGRQQAPFYQVTATVTWELVGDHADEGATRWSLPPHPALLADEDTGLRQIASTLLAAPLSGFFLNREEIGALARQQSLPRGFGDRQQMLLNLMRSAAQYEQFPALLRALQEVVEDWRQAYMEQARAAPTLAASVAVWRERVEETGTMLDRLADEAYKVISG